MENRKSGYDFRICIAGTVLDVSPVYAPVVRYFEDYISPRKCDLRIVNRANEIEAERRRLVAEDRHRQESQTYLNEAQEFSLLHRKIASFLLSRDAIFINGMSVSVDGKGYLLLHHSPAELDANISLRQTQNGEGFRILNDQQTIICFVNQQAMIAGNPWSRVNISAITPLSGIYFINDSLSNQVVQANAADKYPLLWQHSLPSKNATESKQLFSLLGRLVEQVPLFDCGEISRSSP